jgi:hypothetical protein
MAQARTRVPRFARDDKRFGMKQSRDRKRRGMTSLSYINALSGGLFVVVVSRQQLAEGRLGIQRRQPALRVPTGSPDAPQFDLQARRTRSRPESMPEILPRKTIALRAGQIDLAPSRKLALWIQRLRGCFSISFSNTRRRTETPHRESTTYEESGSAAVPAAVPRAARPRPSNVQPR